MLFCFLIGSISASRLVASDEVFAGEDYAVITAKSGTRALKNAAFTAQSEDTNVGDHIRVRYKASYCECTLTTLFSLPRRFSYVRPHDYATIACLLVSHSHFSFSLRGPPTVIC